jgi:Flp pilus assembly pilin Flp
MAAQSIVTKIFSGVNKAGSILADDQGQATLEYALIGLVMINIIVALVTVQSVIGKGVFLEHVLNSVSHGLGLNTGGVIGDVLLY